MSQPAVCEVNECGVLAVGRCGTCRRPFCSTHQARDGSWKQYVDLCAPCFAKTPEQVARAESDAWRKREYAAKHFFNEDPGFHAEPSLAHEALLASGLKPVSIYSVSISQEYRLGLFGRRWVQNEEVTRCEGWVIGEFDWRDDGHDRDGNAIYHVSKVLTVVLHPAARGVLSVTRYKDGYLITKKHDFKDYLSAEVAVKEMTRFTPNSG